MNKDKNIVDKEKRTSGRGKKKVWRTLILVVIFVAGLATFMFPIISNVLYDRAARRVIEDFDLVVEQIEDEEVQEKLKLAYAYNDYLAGINDTSDLEDPYTREEIKEGVAEYARMLNVNEQIGYINIPKIGLDAPLYAGTSETVLQKGIGHMEGTSLPIGGNYTHSVLTGHRGLPTAELFTNLDDLEIGDRFYIKNIGGTIAYQVDQIKIVEPTEFGDLAITPGRDYCTLLTCTPYMINSHRLLVRGHRIEYVEAIKEQELAGNKVSNLYKNLFYISATVLVAAVIYVFSGYLKKRRVNKAQSFNAAMEHKKEGDEFQHEEG